MLDKMKWMLTIVLIWSAAVAAAAPTNGELLAQYKKIYAESLETYKTEHRNAKQSAPIDYIQALRKLQAKLQSDGDLDGWEIVNQELVRFRAEPVITTPVTTPQALREIQNAYLLHAARRDKENNEKVLDLTGKYTKRLADLQQGWTKEGNFDDAFAARDEIKRVNASEVVKEAELSKDAVKPAEDKPTAKDDASGGFSQKITHTDGTVIHPPGTLLSTPSGNIFLDKRLSLSKNAPSPSRVVVRLSDASDKENESFERSHGLVSVDGKERSDVRRVRLALQTAKAGLVEQRIKLQVQYYAKPASGSGDPRIAAKKRTSIPYLDSRTVNVEFAPVSIDSVSRALSKGDRNRGTSQGGDKFYGYVVTVRDLNDALIYQGASPASLANLAGEADPSKKPDDNIRGFGDAPRDNKRKGGFFRKRR
jgi:hypothetical protein